MEDPTVKKLARRTDLVLVLNIMIKSLNREGRGRRAGKCDGALEWSTGIFVIALIRNWGQLGPQTLGFTCTNLLMPRRTRTGRTLLAR